MAYTHRVCVRGVLQTSLGATSKDDVCRCEATAFPCCHGLGQCKIVSPAECAFNKGVVHRDRQLCSQVCPRPMLHSEHLVCRVYMYTTFTVLPQWMARVPVVGCGHV